MHAALLTPRRWSMFEGILQPMHLLVIFGIALLVFGPKKLPELGKGLGAGIRALRDGIKDPLIEPAGAGSAAAGASHDNKSCSTVPGGRRYPDVRRFLDRAHKQ